MLGQDDAGAWIAQNYPGILYLRNKAVYGWAPSDEWLRDNIQSHKPLGDYYPDRKWATEGDSPSFLYVYANGLNVPEEITFGGWGGRLSDIPVENIRGMKFIAQSGKDEPVRPIPHVRLCGRRRKLDKEMGTGDMERFCGTYGLDSHRRVFRRQPPSCSHRRWARRHELHI